MSITLRLESGPDGSWWAKEMLVKVMDKFLFFKKPLRNTITFSEHW